MSRKKSVPPPVIYRDGMGRRYWILWESPMRFLYYLDDVEIAYRRLNPPKRIPRHRFDWDIALLLEDSVVRFGIIDSYIRMLKRMANLHQ